ncbi:hypothetical protein EJB05_35113, partial [Eragrostis curvula]
MDHDIIPEIGSTPTPAPAPSPALEDDDILREILSRLPPLPSSLLRASLVCKRWCGILSDPGFLRHRATPPLLGFFDKHKPVFTPLLRPPNRVPSDRFSLPRQGGHLFVGGVRHGLVLLLNNYRLVAIVCDPVTGSHHTVPYAPEFRTSGGHYTIQGTVLRSDGGGSFKVVLTRTERSGDGDTTRVFMAIYESATGKWSQITSTVIPSPYYSFLPNILVTNALCGFCHWSTGILEFNLDTNTVCVIQTPKSIHSEYHWHSIFRVVRTPDRRLGLAKLGATVIHLWGRTNDGAAARWVLQSTVHLDKLVFPLLPTATTSVGRLHFPRIVGYDEDNSVIHVAVNTSVFTVKLETLQCTKVFDGPWILWYDLRGRAPVLV